jgi:dolichol-phosphate mannosyltransferase
MPSGNPALEVLLPIYNEAESIEGTIREIYEALSQQTTLRFILCEDGSVDGTKETLLGVARQFPSKLIMSDERKGYSGVVLDGMKALEAEYLLCLDSDGQCDPKDFARFWEVRDQQDVTIGWRVKRSDNLLRTTLSRAFYLLYQLFFRVPVHDPSCPFVLAHKRVIEGLVSQLGEMKQGFWWEFTARVYRLGFSVREIPVNHRGRSAGSTRVYWLTRMPIIGYRHLVALFAIWRQTQKHR